MGVRDFVQLYSERVERVERERESLHSHTYSNKGQKKRLLLFLSTIAHKA